MQLYLAVGFGQVIDVFVVESTPETHGAAGVERAQFEREDIIGNLVLEGGARALDEDGALFAGNGDVLQRNGQSGDFAVDEHLLILELDLVDAVGEDHGLFAGRLEVDGNGEVLVQEITGQ